jgi:hypothetical protein
LRQAIKLAGIGTLLLALASLALAQESRVFREGGNWVQEITGSLGVARTLHVKVDMGSVRVEGSTQPGVSYVIRSRSYNSSEQQARRDFELYKISAYSKGDIAWIVGDWQGGRNRNRKYSGEFSHGSEKSGTGENRDRRRKCSSHWDCRPNRDSERRRQASM